MKDTPYYGYCISTLSSLSGVPPGDTALQVAAILGGVSGAMAGLVTAGDEFQHPGFNLINLAGDSPRHKRLQHILLGPLSHYQRQWRETSHATPRSALDLLDKEGWLPGSAAEQALNNRTGYHAQKRDEDRMQEMGKQAMEAALERTPWSEFPEPAVTGDPLSRLGGSSMASLEYRLSQLLRQPSFMLDSPAPSHLKSMINEVHDRALLVVDRDGSLLESLFHEGASSKITQARRIMLRTVTGGDETFPAFRKNQGPGSIQTVTGSLLASIPMETFRELVPGDGPNDMKKLLRHTLLTGPNGEESYPGCKADAYFVGYKNYRDCLKMALEARRSGRGFTLKLDAASQKKFLALQAEFIERIEQAPASLKQYVGHLWNLPSAICWSLMTVLLPDEKADWCMDSALHLANHALDRHLLLLQSVVTHQANAELEYRAAKMLAHILRMEPCNFRDVMRCYSKQTKALHEPVLDYLISEGKVVRFADGCQIATTQSQREKVTT